MSLLSCFLATHFPALYVTKVAPFDLSMLRRVMDGKLACVSLLPTTERFSGKLMGSPYLASSRYFHFFLSHAAHTLQYGGAPSDPFDSSSVFVLCPDSQQEIHAVRQSWETSIGPCRGLWLRFYPTLLRCSFIHPCWAAGVCCAGHVCPGLCCASCDRTGHAQILVSACSLIGLSVGFGSTKGVVANLMLGCFGVDDTS